MNKFHLLIIFLISNVIFAQSNYKFGLEAGPSFKNYRGTDIFNNTKINLGYLVGFSVDYKLNEKFSIKSGLRYEKSTIDYNSEFTSERIRVDDFGNTLLIREKYFVKTTNIYSYLTLPIVLKYKITDTNPFFIDGGIFVSKIFRDNQYSVLPENSNGSYTNYRNYRENFTLESQISNQDYGFILGFGKTFALNKNELSIELVDNLGMYNMLDEETLNGENTNLKSNTISLLLNFSFN